MRRVLQKLNWLTLCLKLCLGLASAKIFMPVQVNAIRFFSDLASSLWATLAQLHCCTDLSILAVVEKSIPPRVGGNLLQAILLCPTWREEGVGRGKSRLYYKKSCSVCCSCNCSICSLSIWWQRPKLQSDKKKDWRLLTSLHFEICICKFNNL